MDPTISLKDLRLKWWRIHNTKQTYVRRYNKWHDRYNIQVRSDHKKIGFSSKLGLAIIPTLWRYDIETFWKLLLRYVVWRFLSWCLLFSLPARMYLAGRVCIITRRSKCTIVGSILILWKFEHWNRASWRHLNFLLHAPTCYVMFYDHQMASKRFRSGTHPGLDP